MLPSMRCLAPFFRKRVQRYCFFTTWQNFSGIIFRKMLIFLVSMTKIKANWQNTDNMSFYCENIDGDAYDGYLQIMRGEPNSVQKIGKRIKYLLTIGLFGGRIADSQSTGITKFLLEIIHYSHICVTICTKVDNKILLTFL